MSAVKITPTAGPILQTPPTKPLEGISKVASVAKAIPTKPLTLTEGIIQGMPLNELKPMMNKLSVNQIDSAGWTPLARAVLKKDLNLITELVKAGADIDGRDRDRLAPIHHALNIENPQVLATLAKLGANLDLLDDEDFLPLESAFFKNDPVWFNYLVALGADTELFQEVVGRKELAHLWDIDGTTTLQTKKGPITIDLLGTHPKVGAIMLEGYLKPFLTEVGVFTKTEKDEIEEAISKVVRIQSPEKNEEVLARVKAAEHKPVIFFGALPGHTFTYVIAGNRFYIANRGTGRDPQFGVVAYRITKPIDLNFIKTLRTEHATIASLYNMPSELGLERMDGESVIMDKATCGNCVWSSGSVGAARVIFHHYNKSSFEKFIPFARELGEKNYLKQNKNNDKGLLHTIAMRKSLNSATAKK